MEQGGSCVRRLHLCKPSCEEQETTRTVASLRSQIRTAQMCVDNDETAEEIMNDEIMNEYEAAMGYYKKAEEAVEN